MKQTLTFEAFAERATKGHPIPLTAETLADLETPVSALARVADREGVFLLESCGQGGKFSRYSFLGFAPRGIFTVEQGKAFLQDARGRRELPFENTPMDALKPLLGETPEAEDLPPFFGGAVGYVG